MTEKQVMSGAEPFFIEGGEVGCLICHGFTGTTQSMRYRVLGSGHSNILKKH